MHNESVRVRVRSVCRYTALHTLKHIHTQHLCCCYCCCSALQWTGLAYWCLRCWRFRRSTACNWCTVSLTSPPERATNTIILPLRRELVCWCYSTERLQPSWSLHLEISFTYIRHGEKMQYMMLFKVSLHSKMCLLLLHLMFDPHCAKWWSLTLKESP